MNGCQNLISSGLCLLKVNDVFSNKTPCFAQSDRSPLILLIPKSFLSSLKMLVNELGK
jgi:hypothetical protein